MPPPAADAAGFVRRLLTIVLLMTVSRETRSAGSFERASEYTPPPFCEAVFPETVVLTRSSIPLLLCTPPPETP